MGAGLNVGLIVAELDPGRLVDGNREAKALQGRRQKVGMLMSSGELDFVHGHQDTTTIAALTANDNLPGLVHVVGIGLKGALVAVDALGDGAVRL